MKRILCFGDSNTYGYKPDGSGRFDETIRWTARLQQKLGKVYQVIEEGLCGRTTIFEDELRMGRKGVDLAGILVETHNPIDVFVVMLGTNDCKTKYQATAGSIAKGLEQVIAAAQSKASKEMKVLIISPILLGQGVGEEGYDIEFDESSEQKAAKLAAEYKEFAKRKGYAYLDASKYAAASPVDREHLDEAGHEKLAEIVYNKLVELLDLEHAKGREIA